MRGLTFELTGPLRRDGLARAGKMYRVPQAGPRRPAVVGPVVQQGVRPHRSEAASWAPSPAKAPAKLRRNQACTRVESMTALRNACANKP
jgi:hypothetical protein